MYMCNDLISMITKNETIFVILLKILYLAYYLKIADKNMHRQLGPIILSVTTMLHMYIVYW